MILSAWLVRSRSERGRDDKTGVGRSKVSYVFEKRRKIDEKLCVGGYFYYFGGHVLTVCGTGVLGAVEVIVKSIYLVHIAWPGFACLQVFACMRWEEMNEHEGGKNEENLHVLALSFLFF